MSTILGRYPRDGRRARLYRWLRLYLGRYRRLARHFPPAGQIVDLACGYGLLAHVLVEDAPDRQVLAVDHDPKRIEALRSSARGLPIEPIQGDMQTVDLPRADGMALVDVMHYLDADAQGALLVRCLRALRPGGVIVIRDPDPGALVRGLLTRLHEWVMTRFGATKGRVRTYRFGWQWADLLKAYDLEVTLEPLPRFWPYADRVVVGRRA